MIRKSLRLFPVSLMVAALFPALSLAQEGSWTASLGAGPSFPVSSLSKEAETGYHFQASLGRRIGDSPLTIHGELFYQLFRNVPREPSLHTSIGGEWFRQADAFLKATYGVPMGAFEPYALVGAGWGQEWHGDRTYYGTRHGNLAINAGAGLNFPLLGRAGFIEARFIGLAGGSPLPLHPPAVQDEVRFRSIPVTAGLRF